MRKHETIDGHNISVWDDGPNGTIAGVSWYIPTTIIDRYTVVDLDSSGSCKPGHVMYLAMSEMPLHPQGVGQTGEMPLYAVAYRGRGGWITKRIPFSALPDECRRCALDWLNNVVPDET